MVFFNVLADRLIIGESLYFIGNLLVTDLNTMVSNKL